MSNKRTIRTRELVEYLRVMVGSLNVIARIDGELKPLKNEYNVEEGTCIALAEEGDETLTVERLLDTLEHEAGNSCWARCDEGLEGSDFITTEICVAYNCESDSEDVWNVTGLNIINNEAFGGNCIVMETEKATFEEPGGYDGEKVLIDVIDSCLPNSYVVLEGDNDTLYVKSRKTGDHYSIKVELCVD